MLLVTEDITIGMYEVMDLFGLIESDEFGNKSYSDEAVEFATQILDTINDVKDHFECDFTFNVEMIPAENCAGVICQADNLIYEQNKYVLFKKNVDWEVCSMQNAVVVVSLISILKIVSLTKKQRGKC